MDADWCGDPDKSRSTSRFVFTLVGKPCHGAIRSKQQNIVNYGGERRYAIRDAMDMKEVVIKYISTNKMIGDPLNKPTLKDAFKTHMISLGLHRV